MTKKHVCVLTAICKMCLFVLLPLLLVGFVQLPQEDIVEFILCRHGETFYNAQEGQPIQGSINDEGAYLDEKGKRQAIETADRIAKSGFQFARMVSSCLNRALQTAQPIASRLNLKLEVDSDFNAATWGVCEGKTRKYRTETYFCDNTGNYRGTKENGQIDWREMTTEERWNYHHIPQGDTVWNVALRLQAAFQRVAEGLAPGEKALIVTHQENLKAFKLFCMRDEIEKLRCAHAYQAIDKLENSVFANCGLFRVLYNRTTGQFSFEGEIPKD